MATDPILQRLIDEKGIQEREAGRARREIDQRLAFGFGAGTRAAKLAPEAFLRIERGVRPERQGLTDLVRGFGIGGPEEFAVPGFRGAFRGQRGLSAPIERALAQMRAGFHQAALQARRGFQQRAGRERTGLRGIEAQLTAERDRSFAERLAALREAEQARVFTREQAGLDRALSREISRF